MPESAEPICCTPRMLPEDARLGAALQAIGVFPGNRPMLERLAMMLPRFDAKPGYLGVLTTKWWGPGGVKLTVSFLERVDQALQLKILAYMNRWQQYANVAFTLAPSGGQVRISLGPGGYWSYLGTDVLSIPANQPTMNLQQFSLSTPESEYERVVVHETGHTLGAPHEHMRRELVDLLDVEKTIRFFKRTQNWNRQMVIQQVLTPIDERSLMGASSPHADAASIMAYHIEGECTKNGQPILGGTTIDAIDREVIAGIYGSGTTPPPPPPPPPPAGGAPAFVVGLDALGKELWRK